MSTAADNLRDFRREAQVSVRAICQDIFAERGDANQVKNEKIAVANLVRIIEATLAIANRKGFAAMRLRELAQRSGLSLGGLYAYISGKDELVALIQHHGQHHTERVLEARLVGIDDPRARLDEAILTHILLSETLRPWFVFLYMEARHLGPAERRQAVAMEQATEARFAAIIRAGQAAGVFRATDATLAAAMLKALLQDWYLKHGKHAGRGLDANAYAAQVQDLMHRYLRPDTP